MQGIVSVTFHRTDFHASLLTLERIMTVWTLHNTLFPDEVEVRIKTFRARVDIRAFDAPFTVDSAASVPDDQKLRNSQH